MSRLPIRARLTAAFALAMVLLLVATGVFVYVRLRADLDEGIDEALAARAGAVADRSGVPGGEPDEGFSQLLAADGSLVSARGGARAPVLGEDELDIAAGRSLVLERRVDGIEGTARVLARPAASGAGAVEVVGQSLEDRDETLAGLVTTFAIGGPLAVLLASMAAYGLATAGLRPVEAMRRRAAKVSLTGADVSLPLPAAHDEVWRLGQTLNEMLERLRSSFERERRFVADASHELRTPIAVLKAELEAALNTGGYGPDVRAALVAGVEECDHLAQLAEDLLVLARAADGRLPLRPERLAAGEVLESARDRFAGRAAAQGRSIRVEVPGGLELWADPLRLRQALGNLVDNALRHGAGDVRLAARPAPGGVELKVSDEGRGFAEGLAEVAFERFTRGDAGRTRGGTGLGLAIVAAVVQAHGGRAALAPQGVAVVTLWLPDPSQGGLSAPPYRESHTAEKEETR